MEGMKPASRLNASVRDILILVYGEKNQLDSGNLVCGVIS